MTLQDLNVGEKAVITKVKGRGAFRKRILEMGFVVGQEITVVKKAPLKDPIEYNVMSYNVSLRNNEAKLIEVVSEKEVIKNQLPSFNGVVDLAELKTHATEKGKTINIAFVGNPNCGKTTIFNYSSGSKERVGNYSGVTVDAKEAKFKHKGYTFKAVDLPGTYSISAYTPEELYVRDYITEHQPDVVINVLDASNLERNLYLTTQLIDMDIKVVAALNMYDELAIIGDEFDFQLLGKMIGIPFIPTIGSKGKGIKDLLEKVIDVYEDRDDTIRHIHINYGNVLEKSINKIQDKIKTLENRSITDHVSSRFLAIKLLESDSESKNTIEKYSPAPEEILETAEKEVQVIEKALLDDSETLVTDAKYGFISGALKETYKKASKKRIRPSELIDNIITHKYWGIPIFVLFMWMTFYFTFLLGQYPQTWIENGVGFLAAAVDNLMSAGVLKDLITQGIIGGVGGVIVYLPNILLLYFFISLMEDTGYMARAVFIMDKAMHKIGLHGKSFIPLLMGFGCNVPAILSTRIIESKRDRLLTILINPFMSCSARLPVYILFISAFFKTNQGSILFLMYGIGVLLAIGTALLFKKTVFKEQDIPFVMELPPYRLPSLRTLIKHMWHRAEQYLRKIGGVILIASIVIWALGYFPRNIDYSVDYDKMIASTEAHFNKQIDDYHHSDVNNFSEIIELQSQKRYRIQNLLVQQEAEKQEKSYIGRIGKTVEPVMAPLGFDWKMTVGIITGVAAKEIVVSTLGVLYQAEEEGDNGNLISKIKNQKYQTGEKKGQFVFSPLVALCFMLFILIYFPCIGVVAAISKETGSWKWAMLVVVYTTGLAWLISFGVYQIGSLFL